MASKVLVVDDDELTVKLLTSRLEDLGHEVVAAAEGSRVLEQTIAEKPDIILMDIMLPDMQGSDAVKLLQDKIDISGIKIIFLSGIISPDDTGDNQIQIGGKFYPAISKPIDFDQLLSYFS